MEHFGSSHADTDGVVSSLLLPKTEHQRQKGQQCQQQDGESKLAEGHEWTSEEGPRAGGILGLGVASQRRLLETLEIAARVSSKAS